MNDQRCLGLLVPATARVVDVDDECLIEMLLAAGCELVESPNPFKNQPVKRALLGPRVSKACRRRRLLVFLEGMHSAPTPPGIVCPYCGHSELRVTRTMSLLDHVRRYRRCDSCGLSVVTREIVRQLESAARRRRWRPQIVAKPITARVKADGSGI